MDLNHQSLLKEISKIPYFQDKPPVTLDDLNKSLFSDYYCLTSDFFSKFEISSVEQQLSLAKKIYAITLLYLLNDMDSVVKQSKYFFTFKSLYQEFKSIQQQFCPDLHPEEIQLIEKFSENVYLEHPNFLSEHILNDFPFRINQIINTLHNNLSAENYQKQVLTQIQFYETTLKSLFDKYIGFGISQQKKPNDLLLLTQEMSFFNTFSSIATYSENHIFDLHKKSMSFSMLDDISISNEDIDHNTSRTQITFPLKTKDFERLYSDIYLYLEKFISPRSIKLTYQYKKSTDNINYSLSLKRIPNPHNKSDFKLALVIDCEKEFSPYLSEFFFQKFLSLKTIFYNIHSDDLKLKSKVFHDFAHSLMKEEREVYLKYALSLTVKTETLRDRKKI